MSAWGRAAVQSGATVAAPPKRLANRSLVCAFTGFIIAVAAAMIFLRMPLDTLQPPWPTLLPLGLGAIIGIIVPLIALVGLTLGIRAVSRPAERGRRAVFGVILNVLLILGIAAGFWSTMSARMGPPPAISI